MRAVMPLAALVHLFEVGMPQQPGGSRKFFPLCGTGQICTLIPSEAAHYTT